jgi:hypothetical protein
LCGFEFQPSSANQIVQNILEFVFDVGVEGLGNIRFCPKVLQTVAAAKLERDEVIDLVIARLMVQYTGVNREFGFPGACRAWLEFVPLCTVVFVG